MIRSGDVIAKLVWVVPEARCSDLDKIVFSWVRMWEAAFGGRFPPIEYRSENGSYLGNEPKRKTSFRTNISEVC